jgi:ABC-type lipoprotein release transport system permease subunit
LVATGTHYHGFVYAVDKDIPVAGGALDGFLSTLLFEIRATHPVVYGLLSIGLIVVALGAALIPAVRASRHNPVTLLKHNR